MIDQPKLIVGIGFPRSVDFERTGRLAARRVAQVRSDTAVFALELLDRVERRVAGEEADRGVQSAAWKQQQREAGTGLLVVDANRARFVKFALPRLLGKHARYGSCRGR